MKRAKGWAWFSIATSWMWVPMVWIVYMSVRDSGWFAVVKNIAIALGIVIAAIAYCVLVLYAGQKAGESL